MYVRDLRAGTTELVDVALDGAPAAGFSGWSIALSSDGRLVAFSSDACDLVGDDTNAAVDVFVRDRATRRTERVSLTSTEQQLARGTSYWDVALDGSGRRVSYTRYDRSGSRDSAGVALRDRVRGTTTRVGGRGSRQGALSAGGQVNAFQSCVDVVPPTDGNGRCDVFLQDRASGSTRLVSAGAGGRPADADSYGPRVSPDGRWVTYVSDATNLVAGDTNGAGDVFLVDSHRADRKGQHGAGRAAGPRGQRRRGDVALRAGGRLPVGRRRPGAGRHQRRAGRLRQPSLTAASAGRARPGRGPLRDQRYVLEKGRGHGARRPARRRARAGSRPGPPPVRRRPGRPRHGPL